MGPELRKSDPPLLGKTKATSRLTSPVMSLSTSCRMMIRLTIVTYSWLGWCVVFSSVTFTMDVFEAAVISNVGGLRRFRQGKYLRCGTGSFFKTLVTMDV